MLQDLQFAIRLLVKDRWFTAIAVVALGLGIGLNATVFTFVNAVLIRGLPFENPGEIYHLNGRNTSNGNNAGVSWLDFEELRGRSRTFSGLAAYRPSSFTLTEGGRPPERVQGAYVTADAFTLLRQAALHGRTFATGEDRPEAAPVALMAHGVWQSRYGGDPALVGSTIKVNDVPCTIVGIMPEGMRFPNSADLWRPLVPEQDDLTRRDNRNLGVFGRLAPGSSRGAAETEIRGIARQLEEQHADTNRGQTIVVLTFNERFNGGPIRAVFLALLGAVGFVLLIACANVANLLLARSATRAREVAVRFALGASRGRVVRQLLVESVLLSALAGVMALGLAHVSVGLFERAVADTGKPYWIQFTFDPIVFAYFAAVSLTTGVLFGLAPALQVSRTNVNEVLKEGGRGSSGAVRARRLASVMVVAEITLTLALLAGAGLMIRSFLKLYSFNAGIETSRIMALRVQLPQRPYDTPERRIVFAESLIGRLDAIPGMQAAALASAIPLGGSESRALEIDGRPAPRPEDVPLTAVVTITPRYFDVVGAGLRRGRGFTESDGAEGAEVAIVNERFVTRFFPGEDVLGRRIRLVTRGSRPETGRWLMIVGVSPTIRQGNPQNPEPDAVVYQPYRLQPNQFLNILTRSEHEPASVSMAVRQAVQDVDANLPVFGVQTLDEFLAQTRWPYRVFGTMFAIFAFIALVLSAVGIYGVTAYSVTQRTPEIGVRMALGAQPKQVSWLILRRGLVQLAVGLTLGLTLAFFASRALGSLLVQIPTYDPVTFGVILVVLGGVTIAACVIPARRATRLDPVRALRAE